MYWLLSGVALILAGSVFINKLSKHDLHEDARLNRLRILGQRGDLNDHYGWD